MRKSDLNRLAASSGAITVSRMIAAGFGFITTLTIARLYGQEAIGLVAIITSMVALFATAGSWGLGRFLIIDFAKHMQARRGDIVQSLLRGSLMRSWGICILLLAPLLFLVDSRLPTWAQEHFILILCLTAATLIGRTMVISYMNASQAVIGVKRFCVLIIFGSAVNTAVVFLYSQFFQADPVVPIVGVTMAATLTGLLAFMWSYAKARTVRPNCSTVEDQTPNKSLLKRSTPFLMIDASGIILMQGSIIVASFFVSVSQMGAFAVAEKIALMASFLFLSINLAATPAISRIHNAKSQEEVLSFVRKAGKFIVLATIPPLLLLIAIRDPLLTKVFGPEYAAASTALLFLLIGQVASSLSGIMGAYLQVTGGQKLLASISLSMSFACLLLVALLTPAYGITGLAAAIAICTIAARILALVAIRARDGVWLLWIPSPKRGQNAA